MKDKIKILMLEDYENDFELFKAALDSIEDLESRIIHVNRLKDVLEKAAREDFDIVLLDLNVPDSNGLETFRSFHKKFPDLPTIIISGAMDQEAALTAVKEGAQDYFQKGERSPALIYKTIRFAMERQRLVGELQSALQKVKLLQGLLPICANCKKIRNDEGYWSQIEEYVTQHSEAEFSHSICPECAKELYPNIKL